MTYRNPDPLTFAPVDPAAYGKAAEGLNRAERRQRGLYATAKRGSRRRRIWRKSPPVQLQAAPAPLPTLAPLTAAAKAGRGHVRAEAPKPKRRWARLARVFGRGGDR